MFTGRTVHRKSCLQLPRRLLDSDADSHHAPLSWIASPVDKTNGSPRFFRYSDATPIELFFDLFFVANLSTFTATHEINNMNALGAYIGFLGVIWFTWLQVTLFDIRFARDSVFERICKAIQLGAMVGFASAGTRFTTPRVLDENVWAFQSLSLILAGSRVLLALQYSINLVFIQPCMKTAARGIYYTAILFCITTLLYVAVRGYSVHQRNFPPPDVLHRCTLHSIQPMDFVQIYGPYGLRFLALSYSQ